MSQFRGHQRQVAQYSKTLDDVRRVVPNKVTCTYQLLLDHSTLNCIAIVILYLWHEEVWNRGIPLYRIAGNFGEVFSLLYLVGLSLKLLIDRFN